MPTEIQSISWDSPFKRIFSVSYWVKFSCRRLPHSKDLNLKSKQEGRIRILKKNYLNLNNSTKFGGNAPVLADEEENPQAWHAGIVVSGIAMPAGSQPETMIWHRIKTKLTIKSAFVSTKFLHYTVLYLSTYNLTTPKWLNPSLNPPISIPTKNNWY